MTNNKGIKIKERFLKIWSDPVWSKVISGCILAVLALLWAQYPDLPGKKLFPFISTILNFELPLYIILMLLGFYLMGTYFILPDFAEDPVWNESIGNYTFRELYCFLLNEHIPTQTYQRLNPDFRPAVNDLLSFFQMYYVHLNKGISIGYEIDDGGYLYNVFAPRMAGIGLVDEFEFPDGYVTYKTSEQGQKFHACLVKVIVASKLNQHHQ